MTTVRNSGDAASRACRAKPMRLIARVLTRILGPGRAHAGAGYSRKYSPSMTSWKTTAGDPLAAFSTWQSRDYSYFGLRIPRKTPGRQNSRPNCSNLV